MKPEQNNGQNTPTITKLINKNQFTRLKGLSVRSMSYLVEQGLPHFKFGTRTYMIDVGLAEEFMRQRFLVNGGAKKHEKQPEVV